MPTSRRSGGNIPPVNARKLRDRVQRRARAAGLDLAEPLLDGLETYYLELAKWNAKVNLTAFSLDGGGSDGAIDRLLIEPVLAARRIAAGATALLDAGSGGGSPAIPLKLARPELALHMVEVKVRKSVFLRQVTRSLGLSQTHVHNARFEELLTRADLHEAMSAVSIRAVRADAKVITTLQAFLAPGGELLRFTTAQAEALPPVPPMTLAGVHELLPGNRSRLVVLRKERLGRRPAVFHVKQPAIDDSN
jgi:16S rRNA (guanine527-N7)-methyltransferase